jgi:hypothetical protein
MKFHAVSEFGVVEVQVLLGELDESLVDIDADNARCACLRHIDAEAAVSAAEIQHFFACEVGLPAQTVPEARVLPRATLEVGDLMWL